MWEYEERLWAQGIELIAGVDEAGRGALYGDVVAACVVLPPGVTIAGVDDSKKLTPKRREELFEEICEKALAIGISCVDEQEIDRINIRQATRLAMRQAVERLAVRPQHLLIDAEQIDVSLPQWSIIRGDQLSQSIAAASIVAKVTRDRLCKQWDVRDPGYGIARHKGYATAFHRQQLLLLGPSPHHRRSFLGKIFQEIGEVNHV